MKQRVLGLVTAVLLSLTAAACAANSRTQSGRADTAAAEDTEAAAAKETDTSAAEETGTSAVEETDTAAAEDAGTSAAEETDTTAAEDTEPSAQETAERVFTDSVGREVTLPGNIDRIAVSGPLAQMVLFSLAPDELVGIATEWDKTAAEYLDTEYYNLPVLGQLYGGKGELNLEELLKADPQVVIDVGEPKGSIAEDLDALQEQTGIPFVHVTMTLSDMPEAYEMLGELLGLQEEAAERAAYCKTVYEEISGKAPSLEKKSLLLLTGEEGLNVIAKGSYHAEVIDLLADNRAVLEDPSSKGTGNEVDFEQILNWNPEVILFTPDSAYDKIAMLPEWQELDAVRNGTYYEIPFGPHNWMGFYPSVQRCLGMQWMLTLLNPEEADFDLYERVAEYYRLFYHCELTREQYDALLADSLLKDAQ